MIQITPGLSEYLKRGDGTLWQVPWFHYKQETTEFFKYFLPAQKEMAKVWLQNYPHELNLQTRATSLLRTVCFIPGERKPLHFLLIRTLLWLRGGPQCPMVVMGGVRWGVYSRTALFQGGAYFKITFLTIWNLTLNQLIATAVNTK